MTTPGKKLIVYKSRKCFSNEENSKAVSMPKNQNSFKVANNKRCYLKPGYWKKNACKRKNTLNGKLIETPQKKFDSSLDKCISSFKLTGKRTCFIVGKNSKNSAGSPENKTVRRRRLKRAKKSVVQDDISRMQRRARYLLIKIKLEQNLIDAYSGDGWKGLSREKIKPVNELQRAERHILKCKLGIRDSIQQLDLLGSEGRIEDSVMHPDGSVFHEYIFCAKCKSREAFPDNDIILCDGICNCGFHQKCLEPPLEKIPPGDQGWLCKICNCKTEILETINAHLGTCFTVNSSWEDIFKEAIAEPNTEGGGPNLLENWPSNDSEDEDYCPENTSNKAEFEENFSDEGCSSIDSILSSDASLNFISCLGSGESSDEIANYRRKRRYVDYKKLYDEMFGKELNEDEEQSEDEDWGPCRKKKGIASGICIKSIDGEDKESHQKIPWRDKISCDKRSFFRIPPDAIEVDKWFKNSRYSAIKIRKEHAEVTNQARRSCDVSVDIFDESISLDSSCFLPLASIFHLPRHKRRISRIENSTRASSTEAEQVYINEMHMLWVLERRLHQLKQQLLVACKGHLSVEEAVVYVPVAELKEKAYAYLL